MRSFGCLFLWLLATVLLVGVLVAWGNASVLDTIEPRFCSEVETMRLRLFASYERPVDIYCYQIEADIRRPLTLLSYAVVTVQVVLPLLGLLLLVINIAIDNSVERQVEMLRVIGASRAFTLTREDGIAHIEIRYDGRANELSLEDKLFELKKVQKAGIISTGEYERVRLKVLEDFSDE